MPVDADSFELKQQVDPNAGMYAEHGLISLKCAKSI